MRFNTEYETYLNKIRNPLYKAQDYADQVELNDGTKDEGIRSFAESLLRAAGLDVQEFFNPAKYPEYLVGDLIAAYDGEIAFVDDQVHRIFDLLKDEGLYDSTIIIIIGDHGEILYEKEEYFGHHKYLYQGSMCIPLVMKIPGIVPKEIDERITNVDILPTLLEALSIESKVAMDGMSYWPLIKDGTMERRRDHLIYVTHIGKRPKPKKQKSTSSLVRQIRTFSETIVRTGKRVFLKIFGRSERWKVADYFEKYAVVKDEWKLMRSNDGGDKKKPLYELYNIKADPEELHNLVEAESEVFRELNETLDLYMRKKRFRAAPSPFEGKSKSQTQEEIQTLRSLGYM
jgi:arylsulfatase A-like enzyme